MGNQGFLFAFATEVEAQQALLQFLVDFATKIQIVEIK
jgi:hypothetical protein